MKFRALPVNGPYKNKFVYGSLVWDHNENPFIVGTVVESCEEYINFEFWVPVRKETIGQYVTTDKQGREVYEGDIFQDEAGRVYTIRYDEDQGAFTADEPEHGWISIDDVLQFEHKGSAF